MNTANNINLNKINGEYVKFYVTTNSALPEILKNTGAIVIYNDIYNTDNNNLSYATNYIYLGNQLIASGWGLDSKELKTAATYICNNWNYITHNIKNSYTYLNNQIINLNNIISNKLIQKDGNISNTYIINNNETITISDAVFKTIEQDYKPLEIIDEENIVKYYDYPTNEINNYEKTAISKNNDPVYIPIGSYISSASKNIKYKFNDDEQYMSYYGGIYSYYNISNGIYNFDNIKPEHGIFSTDKIKKITNNTEGILQIEKKYLENPISKEAFIVKDGEQEILAKLCCWNNGTDISRLKKLSYINNSNNIINLDIYSVKNIKCGRQIDINPVKIFGTPSVLTYSNINKVTDTTHLTINDMDKNGIRTYIGETANLIINKGTHMFYLALPETAIIDYIVCIDPISNESINITSNFIELYNDNKKYYISKYPILKIDENILKYKVYCCRYSEDFAFDNTINITIKLRNQIKSVNTFTYNLNIENNSIVPDFSYWDIVKNEDYYRNNWIYTNSDNDIDNIFFKFMDNKYLYYYSAIKDDVYESPLNNWNFMKKYNQDELQEKIININDNNIKYLIVPEEIYKNYDFFTASPNHIKLNKKNAAEGMFEHLDNKFIRLAFTDNVKTIEPAIYAFIGSTINSNNLNDDLITNGMPYTKFIKTYLNKEFTIKEIYHTKEDLFYRLYMIFPIFTNKPIEFKIKNITKELDVFMNNIDSFRFSNTLYGVYKSVMKIHVNDTLRLIEINK